MKNQKVQCRLCEQYFNDEDMSEEHYPAHCVGNDDIIALDFIKYMDTCMGNNRKRSTVSTLTFFGGCFADTDI